jgi:outer membrane lipopolysaccharide assembly protein LptE/RlpB
MQMLLLCVASVQLEVLASCILLLWACGNHLRGQRYLPIAQGEWCRPATM